jgi:hypothetical protein
LKGERPSWITGRYIWSTINLLASEQSKAGGKSSNQSDELSRVSRDQRRVHGGEADPVTEDLVHELTLRTSMGMSHEGGRLEGEGRPRQSDRDEERWIFASFGRGARTKANIEAAHPL